jgi:hypothetical protein
MKTTFINKTIEKKTFNRDNFTYTYFDMLGSLQTADRYLTELKNQYMSLMDKIGNSSYRQREDSRMLSMSLGSATLEKYFLEFPQMPRGKIDNIPVLPEKISYISTFDVLTQTLSSNKELYKSNFSSEIYKQGNKTVAHISSDENGVYTLLHIKLPAGQRGVSFVVDKNYSEIVEVKFKNQAGWQTTFDQNFASNLLSPVVSDSIPFDFVFEEVKIILKNILIGKEYSNLISFAAIAEDYVDTAIDINWVKGITANRIFKSPLLDDGDFIVEGFLSVGQNIYNVQIPTVSDQPTLNRLELEEYIKIGGETYSIFRCPFPVDLNEDLEILKEIRKTDDIALGILSEDTFYVPNFKVSFTKAIDSWISYPGALSYSLEFTKTPKYLYVQVPGFYEVLYASYNINFMVNCEWPMSSDRQLMLTSSGIEILNKNNDIVSFVGKAYTYKNLLALESQVIGVIGVD